MKIILQNNQCICRFAYVGTDVLQNGSTAHCAL